MVQTGDNSMSFQVLNNSQNISEANGTTPVEIFLLSSITCQTSQMLLFLSYVPFVYNNRIFLHSVLLNGMALLVATAWDGYLLAILIAIICVCLATAYKVWKHNSLVSKPLDPQSQACRSASQSWHTLVALDVDFKLHDLPFVAEFRGQILLLTAVSILAVDFPIFPNRFSKTEKYGWSPMDNGVGCFVILHGMCSAHARGKYVSRQVIWKTLHSSFPLVVLGFLRLIVLTAVHYHQSVSEYGIHWNFFFTLGLTKVCGAAFCILFPFTAVRFLSLFIVLLHQWLLSFWGMTDIILSKNRENLFMANKEGICSMPGFVALYLIGVEIGKLLWKPRFKMKHYLELLVKLVIIGICTYVLMHVFDSSIQRVSRRMANLPYFIWIVSFTSLQLAIFLGGHLLFIIYCKLFIRTSQSDFKCKPECVLQSIISKAINYNGLFYFLLSNALTGIINLAMKTEKASSEVSFIILFLYLSVLSTTVVLMFQKNIQLKF